jgi:hypothetical protein
MKTRLGEIQWQSDERRPEGRPCSGTPGRLAAVRPSIHLNLWDQGHVAATLTTQSFASHSGIPVLRVKDPTYKDSIDLGPADFVPGREDDPPETAAELLVHINAHRPLEGKILEGARRFLSQWPDGPQLP